MTLALVGNPVRAQTVSRLDYVQRIIPQFKQGRYAEGIRDGVQALAEIAALGPAAEPPEASLGDQFQNLRQKEKITPLSFFDDEVGLLLIGLGAALCVLSIFLPDYRKWLLIAGFGLIGVVLLSWIVIFIIALFAKRNSGDTGGGFSSGGGFSGGFSGGGGASGSW